MTPAPEGAARRVIIRVRVVGFLGRRQHRQSYAILIMVLTMAAVARDELGARRSVGGEIDGF